MNEAKAITLIFSKITGTTQRFIFQGEKNIDDLKLDWGIFHKQQ